MRILKLKVKLAVSDEAFYEVLMTSVKDDIFQNTGREVNPHVGFEYKRKLPRMVTKTPIETSYQIAELVENQKYTLNVVTPADTTIVSYTITRLAENKIQVDYFEDTAASKARVALSNKALRFIFSIFFAKRRMKKKFRQIETYINQQNKSMST